MENGKGWSPINTDAIVCSSLPAPCYKMLLFHSALPQFNLPPPPTYLHLLLTHSSSIQDINVGSHTVKTCKIHWHHKHGFQLYVLGYECISELCCFSKGVLYSP